MKKFLAAVMVLMMLLVSTVPTYAACTQAISTQAKGNFLAGMFRKGDTYKIAFYTDSATYSAATSQYSATNEVSGTNYTAGGFTLDSLAYGTSSTTYWMDWADEVNNTITFTAASTCAIIYDATTRQADCTGSGAPYPCCTAGTTGCNGDVVIGVFTFTSVQPSAGTLTVTFPAADASNAIVRIAAYDWIEKMIVAELMKDGLVKDAVVQLEGVGQLGELGGF